MSNENVITSQIAVMAENLSMKDIDQSSLYTVSYTHLTLPTIYSV